MEQSEIVKRLRKIHILVADIMALDDRSRKAKQAAREDIFCLLAVLGEEEVKRGNVRDISQ